MRIDGIEITLGFVVGLALGYYFVDHWRRTGRLIG